MPRAARQPATKRDMPPVKDGALAIVSRLQEIFSKQKVLLFQKRIGAHEESRIFSSYIF